jgi:integrase
MSVELTEKYVVTVKPPEKGKLLISDSLRRTLYLRVMPTGTKTFEMRTNVGGKWKVTKLGVSPRMSCQQARLKCADALGKVDPTAEPDQKRTLLDVADAWHRNANHKHPEEARRYIDRDLEPLHRRRIESIRTDELLELFERKRLGDDDNNVKAAPAAAIKLSRYALGIFKFAAKRKWVAENPLNGIVPSDWGAKKETPRKVALTHDEIRAAWNIPAPHATLYRLLLATGQRLMEVQALATHPEQIVGDVWHIDENKSDRPHRVPVLPLMRRLLKEPMAKKGRASAHHLWQKYMPLRPESDKDKVIAGRRVHQHDIRHTVASAMQELGIASDVIEALLNHASPYVYQHGNMQPRMRDALAKWHRKLLAIVKA